LLEKGKGEDGGFTPTPRFKDLVLAHFLKAALKEDEQVGGKEEDGEKDENA
jgi:hypothetical protein